METLSPCCCRPVPSLRGLREATGALSFSSHDCLCGPTEMGSEVADHIPSLEWHRKLPSPPPAHPEWASPNPTV